MKRSGETAGARLGRYTVYTGILLAAVGLIGGFAAMFRDADSLAVNLLNLVPLGFVLLLAGTVISQLSGPPGGR
ncbi:MAG TPA: hypothetical protein ENJ79_10775 [Gammaproteobacteria bacterium]|nr:hypothetical protein [Gammaproteobacteria bacterium]